MTTLFWQESACTTATLAAVTFAWFYLFGVDTFGVGLFFGVILLATATVFGIVADVTGRLFRRLSKYRVRIERVQ